MAKLSINDLKKPSNKGGRRLDILMDKINRQEPFKLDDNTLQIIEFATEEIENAFINKQWDKMRGKCFITGKNRLLRVSNLMKTAEFGGSGGLGGGVDIARLTESAQCYYASLAINVKKNKFVLIIQEPLKTLKMHRITPTLMKRMKKSLNVFRMNGTNRVSSERTYLQKF